MPLLATLFNYREFGANDVLMSASALQAYALGLVGFVFVKVLAPGFFARQNTATPVRVGVVSMLVNVALSLGVGLVAGSRRPGACHQHRGAGQRGAAGAHPETRRRAADLARARAAGRSGAGGDGGHGRGAVVRVGASSAWLDAGVLERAGRLVICVLSGLIVYGATLVTVGVRPGHLALNDA
ncbi:MAG: hypothetical protein M5U09_13860 [Gammaproteobacteria bacterium]|nr:hypothetical protein [Gammaproteobacteria bacterium]